MTKIGVGLIGASPLTPGWAVLTHIPALRAHPDYELRAVGTSNPASAAAAREAFGVPAFDDHRALIAHPGVDLVVVSVKLPHHRALISAALDARKMVLSEWPLGTSLAESRALAEQAAAAGVRTAIGLQGRYAPALRHARTLIRDGYLGRVLATTLVASSWSWGPEATRAQSYLYDAASGASPLSISAFHAIDALNTVLGDFTTVTGRLGTNRGVVRLIDGPRDLPVTAPDSVAIAGGLEGGATASIFYRAGNSRGDKLRWEIIGTEGDLFLRADEGNIQTADLRLFGGRGGDTTVTELDVPGRELPAGLAEAPGGNVYRLYDQLAADLRHGTHHTPDFERALHQHRVIAAIEHASATLPPLARA